MSHHSEEITPRHVPIESKPQPAIVHRERVLGYSAVVAANVHAELVVEMSSLPLDSRDYAVLENIETTMAENIPAEANRMRGAFDTLDAKSEGIADRYLNSVAPLFIMRQISALTEEGEPEMTWKTWFNEVATASQLLNLAQAHATVIDKQRNSRVIAEAYQRHLQDFLSAADRLAEEGKVAMLPKDASKMRLAIGDIFDTTLKEMNAYFDPQNPQEVVMAQASQPVGDALLVADVIGRFPRDLTHEFVHGLLCRSYEVVGSPIAARWINEALTEQFSRDIRKKNDDTLPIMEDHVYIRERQLLGVLLQRSPDPDLSLKRAHIAYSGEAWDRDLFYSDLDTIWETTGVLEKINDAITKEEIRIKASPEGKSLTENTIQTQAVVEIKKQLEQDPNALLRIGADKILREMGVAAQES